MEDLRDHFTQKELLAIYTVLIVFGSSLNEQESRMSVQIDEKIINKFFKILS